MLVHIRYIIKEENKNDDDDNDMLIVLLRFNISKIKYLNNLLLL